MVQAREMATMHDDLLAVAVALERMALEIRQEVAFRVEEEEEGPMPVRPPVAVPVRAVPVQAVPVAAAGLQGGQRVRITVRDQYYGRYGTLVDRRGTKFWHILMDAVDGRVAHIIYKKDSSLEVVNDN